MFLKILVSVILVSFTSLLATSIYAEEGLKLPPPFDKRYPGSVSFSGIPSRHSCTNLFMTYRSLYIEGPTIVRIKTADETPFPILFPALSIKKQFYDCPFGIRDQAPLYIKEYDFEHNKGYGTKKHIEAIYKYGVLDNHRKTFEPIASIISEKQI